MSKLHKAVEFIALNDNPGGDATVSDMTGLISIQTASICLGVKTHVLASMVLHYREKGEHIQIYKKATKRPGK